MTVTKTQQNPLTKLPEGILNEFILNSSDMPLRKMAELEVVGQPLSPKGRIWHILNEKPASQCSHSHLCCACLAGFSFKMCSNPTFYRVSVTSP